MASYTDSPSEIMVAWATRVSIAQLGARLCAYAETKAKITTFRFVVRHTNLTACRKLPEEIISLIASKIRDIAFKHRIKKWVKIERCLTNDWYYERYNAEANRAHQEDLRRYCEILANLKGTSRFAKCVQRLLDATTSTCANIIQPRPRCRFLFCQQCLEPICVGRAQLRKFKLAANTLELHVYNPIEEFARLDDQSLVGESPNSDGDCESGDSMDGEDEGNGAKSYGTDSQALTSDGAELRVQVTAENTSGGSKYYAVAPEPSTEQAERETLMDVDPEETGALWLQLMILGWGELRRISF